MLGRASHEIPFRDLRTLLDAMDASAYDFLFMGGDGLLLGSSFRRSSFSELVELGIHAVVIGDYPVSRPLVREGLTAEPWLLRPLNLPPGAPGEGSRLFSAEGSRLALGVVLVNSDRPFDDPFQQVELWLRALPPEFPAILILMGSSIPLKQAVFWKLGQLSRPVHVLGLGLGVGTSDTGIFSGRAWVGDIGEVCREGGVGGCKPEVWWALERERQVREAVPADGALTADAISLELDEQGRPRSLKRLRHRLEIW